MISVVIVVQVAQTVQEEVPDGLVDQALADQDRVAPEAVGQDRVDDRADLRGSDPLGHKSVFVSIGFC